MPVAWSVDPANSERFPALMDWFASTATPTDSFIGGVAGAGYVYLGSLSEQQLQRYTARVGKLYKEYGPEVADTCECHSSLAVSRGASSCFMRRKIRQ